MEQNDYDRSSKTKNKHSSSEKNMFFSNIAKRDVKNDQHNMINNSHKMNDINHMGNVNNNDEKTIDNNNKVPKTTEKIKGRVERTKSFLINGFMKRCKSSRDLFSSQSSEFNVQNESKLAAKQCQGSMTTLTNDAATYNNQQLDEFERNFLSSAGKKILVRELRKNFESSDLTVDRREPMKLSTVRADIPSCRPLQTVATPSATTTAKSSTTNIITKPLIRLWKSKSTVSALKRPPVKKKVSGQEYAPSGHKTSQSTAPVYPTVAESSKYDNCPSAVATDCTNGESPRKALISRHSFYNTYRNEYLATSDKHSSNLSLNFCGTKPSFAPTASKPLTNSTRTSNRDEYGLKRFSSTAILNDIEAAINSNMYNNSCSRSLYSVNSLNADDDSINYYIGNYNNLVDFDYQTVVSRAAHNEEKCMRSQQPNQHQQPKQVNQLHRKSLNKNTNHQSNENLRDNGFHELDFSRCSNMRLAHNGSNNNSDISYNNINNNKSSSSKSDQSDNVEADLFKIYVQCNNKINNINNSKLRKCNSVNQIDMDMLRYELDGFVDMKWHSTNFYTSSRSQRCLYRKVNYSFFLFICLIAYVI